MMRSPKAFVVAVRRPDGAIAVREETWQTFFPGLSLLRKPLIRGAIVLLESLHNGFSALKFSADQAMPVPVKSGVASILAMSDALLNSAPDEPPKQPAAAPSKAIEWQTTGMLVLSVALMLSIFVALPHFLTFLVGKAVGSPMSTQSVSFHLVDGVLRIGVLVGYLWILARTPDAQVLFRYHGAEHKAIWTYESFKPLLVSEARPFTTRHPRCGTSFLFVVVGVAVLVHIALLPLVPRLHENGIINQILMVFVKIPLAFPIAGIAYEIQRWSAKPECPAMVKGLARPGIWLQSITTLEPTDAQQEIALLSLERALQREEGQAGRVDGVFVYDGFSAARQAA